MHCARAVCTHLLEMLRDSKISYADMPVPARVRENFKQGGDNQICVLELLAILFGTPCIV